MTETIRPIPPGFEQVSKKEFELNGRKVVEIILKYKDVNKADHMRLMLVASPFESAVVDGCKNYIAHTEFVKDNKVSLKLARELVAETFDKYWSSPERV